MDHYRAFSSEIQKFISWPEVDDTGLLVVGLIIGFLLSRAIMGIRKAKAYKLAEDARKKFFDYEQRMNLDLQRIYDHIATVNNAAETARSTSKHATEKMEEILDRFFTEYFENEIPNHLQETEKVIRKLEDEPNLTS